VSGPLSFYTFAEGTLMHRFKDSHLANNAVLHAQAPRSVHRREQHCQ